MANRVCFFPKIFCFRAGWFLPLIMCCRARFSFSFGKGVRPFPKPQGEASTWRLSGSAGVWGSGAPPCNNNRVAIITENPCGMQYRSFPSGKSTGLLPSRFILRNRAPGIGTHQNAQQEALWKRKTGVTHEKPPSEKGSGRRTKRRNAQRKDTIAHCKCNLLRFLTL